MRKAGVKRLPAFSAFLNVVTAKCFCGKHGRHRRLFFVLFGGRRGRTMPIRLREGSCAKPSFFFGRGVARARSWDEVGKT